jgi:hypothetical protein
MKTTVKPRTLRRHVKHGRLGKPMVLKPDHNAIVEATTIFPSRVAVPDYSAMLFKEGKNNSKIGNRVIKGAWSGMPIYTLTLEERATCPTICGSWHSCYGNHMQWPTRWKAGPALEKIIPGQVATLARKHPRGFVIRLHILGDFYSRQYVQLWDDLMFKHPELHVYGYTRCEKHSPEGQRIAVMNATFPDRWRIRWSERGGEMGTVTIKDVTARGRIAEGIVCPAQTEGDEVCCSSCALCWSTDEPIVFIDH